MISYALCILRNADSEKRKNNIYGGNGGNMENGGNCNMKITVEKYTRVL